MTQGSDGNSLELKHFTGSSGKVLLFCRVDINNLSSPICLLALRPLLTMHDVSIVVIEFQWRWRHDRDMTLWVITLRWKQLLRPRHPVLMGKWFHPRWQSGFLSLLITIVSSWSSSWRNQSLWMMCKVAPMFLIKSHPVCDVSTCDSDHVWPRPLCGSRPGGGGL